MNNSKKVLVLKGDSYKAVGEMFERHGYSCTYDTSSLSTVDLVVFTGGSDVSPYIYGEEPDGARDCDPVRDEFELSIYHKCVKKNVPMIGICRGGQLLNVLNGGTMIQHLGKMVSGIVEDDEDREMMVDHHQGMLMGSGGILLSYLYDEYWGSEIPEWPDYAICYEGTRSLCFQPHPEWGHKPTEDFFFELVNQYV